MGVSSLRVVDDKIAALQEIVRDTTLEWDKSSFHMLSGIISSIRSRNLDRDDGVSFRSVCECINRDSRFKTFSQDVILEAINFFANRVVTWTSPISRLDGKPYR